MKQVMNELNERVKIKKEMANVKYSAWYPPGTEALDIRVTRPRLATVELPNNQHKQSYNKQVQL